MRSRSEPLQIIDAISAFENIKTNTFSSWPNRDEPNRVEPTCEPEFTAPFRIVPGSSIFTIGSCFARNVEKSLMQLGFEIPALRALGNGESSAVLNNYTAPSMLNEIRWALDETEYFDPDIHLYRINASKFVDLHLGGRWTRPTDLETALDRRKRLNAAYKTVPKSKLLILTLGLSEAWHDNKLSLYLNSPPLKGLVEREPNRFSVHVLRYEQIVESLHQLISIVRNQEQGKDIKVLITVSPIPLQSTFRSDTDVIVSNCYSKSVLRAAAEEICGTLPNCAYYPSYESITTSSRYITWEDDLIHARQEIIDLNIGRMVARYVDLADSDVNDADILVQRAIDILNCAQREDNTAHATHLIDRALKINPIHSRAIFAKVLWLHKQGRSTDAIAFFKEAYPEFRAALKGQSMPIETRLLIGRILLAQEELDQALEIILDLVNEVPSHMPTRIVLGDIYVKRGDYVGARNAFEGCLRISKRVGLPYFKLATLELALGNTEKAKTYAELAATINPDNLKFSKLFRDVSSLNGMEA